MFEGWDEAKLEQYNIDIDTYDYTDVSARQALLHKYPFLITIHLCHSIKARPVEY